MSRLKVKGHASGSGTVTVTAPNTSTDRTITLPDADAIKQINIDNAVDEAEIRGVM